MRTNFKRITCLFLTLVMLMSLFPVEALAVETTAPASGTAYRGGGVTTTSSGWGNNYSFGAGLLLHVESMGKYTSQNYKDAIGYWTNHFPSTNANIKQTGYYVLPKYYSGKQYAIVDPGVGNHDRAEIHAMFMAGECQDLKNGIGLDAFAEAKRNSANPHNPNMNLPGDYWQKVVATQSGDSFHRTLNIISTLFSASDVAMGLKEQSDIDAINTRIQEYLGLDGMTNDPWYAMGAETDQEKEVALFMNYCSFLATIIAASPDTNERSSLAKELDNMCQNFLSGAPYHPMVVTGELVVSSFYAGSSTCVTWWTPKQCLQALSGQSSLPDIQGTTDYLRDFASRSRNVSKSIGGMNMYGYIDGDGFTPFPGMNVWGGLIRSISPAVLASNGHGDKQPIKGFGVWGLNTEPYEAPPAIPAVKEGGEMTPMGSCGIEVKEKTYIEESLSYSEELEVTEVL